MKKSLIALAVLAASGASMAQSSVTLYGIADVFVGSKKVNGLSQAVVDSGGLNGSRWGLKGSEDLGGGLKAVFVLESGFDISTGAQQQGALFGRQAFVGLNSDSFGSVSLGRQYGAYDVVKGGFLSAQGNSPAFDATNGAAVGAPLSAARLGAWTGYTVRLDNSIRYATPNISGFQGAVVYGLGENKTPTTDATRNVSASLTYANGPIGLALTHQDEELTPTVGLKNTAIGGYYDFGVAKVFAAYNYAKYDGLAKQNEWSIGARAPLGATTLVAQYAHSKGDDLGKNQSLGLSAEYGLSKRTTAYAGLNYTKTNLNTTADIKNHVVGLGVRHAF
ncbi:MAG: porin [Pseudomonadota bacterium]|nr:porin [Pseudomonadota bacterium]